jgi:type I restriction enzyme S subunit
MWFRRPEFDRYARFMSHGSAREIFGWEEMCNTLLPIPSIAKQREIVKEYNVVQNSIALNQQLIQKLEETAQAIYKQWFVDFEFPDENGQPYKSNGGEMEFNEELKKDIPEGWAVKKLEELTNQICVAFVGSVYKYYCDELVGIPMLRTTDITETGVSYKDLKYVTKEFHAKNRKSQLKKGDLLVARHGSNGMPVIFDADFEANALNAIIIKPDSTKMSSKLVHCFLTSKSALEHIQASLGGSVQEVLNTQKISDIKVVFPNDSKISNKVSNSLEKIQRMIEHYRKQKNALEVLMDLLLSKLAAIKN